MQVRAAVLEEFGRPLVVHEVDLAEPKAGEALVRLQACGVCHTDLYAASGAPIRPATPTACSATRAPASSRRSAPDVTLVAPGDHVVTLFAPECGECVHCRSPRTNRCTAIRDQQGEGLLPDGTTRFRPPRRRAAPPLHGHLDVRRVHGDPGDRARTVSPEAPLDACAPFACGLSTGIGAALYTAEVARGRRASSSAAASSASAR